MEDGREIGLVQIADWSPAAFVLCNAINRSVSESASV